MGVALSKGDCLRAYRTPAALRLERDVRSVAEDLEEIAVRLTPGAALVPAEERERRAAVLAGEPVEAGDVVSVDPDRDPSLGRRRGHRLKTDCRDECEGKPQWRRHGTNTSRSGVDLFESSTYNPTSVPNELAVILVFAGIPVGLVRIWWIWWHSGCGGCGYQHNTCICPAGDHMMRPRR